MARRRRPRSSTATAAVDAGSLCLECGLCCDGTVFAAIIIEDDEREKVTELGLTLEDRDGLKAPQPCPAFVDGCCALYQVGRPRTCEVFACALLTQLAEGRAQRDDCRSVIAVVRSLARDMEQAMGLARGEFTRIAARDYIDEHHPDRDPEAHAAFLVPFTRLAVLGVKYFGYPVDPGEQAAVDAGETVASSASTR